ncbi:unnamed protein product [Brassica napus]|uniref:(rape) hypothetical protein n=1 Tax=Brassica napus TaxID=3708 RepID=A0A816K3P7_BRANA|nr:unnamed protein product [Brassica napus]
MFELWFREMEATTDPSSPVFLQGVEAPSAPPTPVQGKVIRAADEKPEAFGSRLLLSSRFDDEALRRGEVGQVNN